MESGLNQSFLQPLTLTKNNLKIFINLIILCIISFNLFLFGENSIGSLGHYKSEDHVAKVMVDGANIHGTTNGVRIKTWQVRVSLFFLYTCTTYCVRVSLACL